jgi:tetratricopeptide (TPR) repeat protein
MSTPEAKSRLFVRADWTCGGIAGLVAFAVYFWTTAPNVTLLDSGEFIVAAQHFGVPHPTGYPLWTLLGWIFQLLPLGNAAWEINLLSGVLGAMATGLAAMLIRSSSRWILEFNRPTSELLQSVVAISVSLTFAFSFSMWSQAVIAEVYTLHALLVGFFFVSLYAWLRNPTSERPIYWTFFTLALAFSNHHLCLVLIPLPFLVALLVRKDLLPDLIMASLLAALLGYLGFAALADNPLVLKAALRFAWLIGPVFVVFLIIRRARVHFRLIAFLPFLLALGMLPYAYLPIASSTNPPMNWGYTRTLEGFFASFNRSQYQGSLSDQSLRVLTNIVGMGTSGPSAKAAKSEQSSPAKPLLAKPAFQWGTFFWQKLIVSFSPLSLILFFGAIFAVIHKSLERRVWCYVVLIGFALAAFLQPAVDKARIDNAGWWLQMPYHTYTNFIFALACGIGALFLLSAIPITRVFWQRAGLALLALMPLWPLFLNADGASQRNRWFGWKFGHDMLHALPPGAVVFGGSDPGRFVPTYMIFGESSQDPSVKRAPDFDRRDLYIITQNATGDPLYLSYLRDHYQKRPAVANSFEMWLGRDEMYPATPIELPTRDEVKSLLTKQAEELNNGDNELEDRRDLADLTHGEIAKWIFEKNKPNHRFFVEESYPMLWSYDHAIPSGLLYEIAPDPMDEIPAEAVEADMQFWQRYVSELLADPAYSKDFDAQRSFSKLRLTTARIYEHRKLTDQAKQAFKESIALWPGHLEAINSLSQILWKEGDFETPVQLFENAFNADPKSPDAAALFLRAHEKRETAPQIAAALAEYRAAPDSFDAFRNAVKLLAADGNQDQFMALYEEATPRLGDQDAFLSLMTDLLVQLGEVPQARALAEKRALALNTADLWLDVAAIDLQQNDIKAATESFQKAHTLDATRAIERLSKDPFVAPLRAESQIKELLSRPSPPTP